jgi:hypothetical protein
MKLLLDRPYPGSIGLERPRVELISQRWHPGVISIEQARVRWVKKTLESGEITIENPLSPLAPDIADFPLSHTSRPLFSPLPPSNPCNRVSTIILSVILLCIFHVTTLP